MNVNKSMIAFIAECMVATAGFAVEPLTYDNATNRIAEAFVPIMPLRVMNEATVQDAMSLPGMMEKDVRYSLESNICWRIIDFPTSLERDQALFWIWRQKCRLCTKIAAFDYWHTNRTALLRFATHIGVSVNVSTNSFLYERMIAAMDDEWELEMERVRCKLQGKPFMPSPVNPGRNAVLVKNKIQCAKIWNTYLPKYRECMIVALSCRIKECLDALSPEDRKRFMEEFASRAKLSQDERKIAFGDHSE